MDRKNFNAKSKKQRALLGLVAIIFFTVFFLGASYKTVNIHLDDNKLEVNTTSSEPKKILENADIPLGPYDRIETGAGENVRNGDSIYVYRAMEITINDGGAEYTAHTTYRRVEDIIEELEIQLNPLDRIQPNPILEISGDDTITISRVEERKALKTSEVPFEEEIIYVDDLDPGERRIVEEGEEGIFMEAFIDTYVNGEKQDRRLEKEEIISEPITQVVEKGEVLSFKTADGSRYEYSEAFTMKATAYTAGYESTGKRPGDPGYGITRSGTRVRPGVVAVDPRVIPLGTRLYVESLDGSRSYGFATAEDTGGAIKGHKIDLYYENVNTALRFGRRNVRVYILD